MTERVVNGAECLHFPFLSIRSIQQLVSGTKAEIEEMNVVRMIVIGGVH